MARNISAAHGAVYRAVIDCVDTKGVPYTKHEGPYAKPAAAQARVTFWENYLAEYDDEGNRTGSRAKGRVEEGTVEWKAWAPGKKRGRA